MSRKQAAAQLSWKDVIELLKEQGVPLLSVGNDEVPYVFKAIDEIMAAQSDLVEPLARFFPPPFGEDGAGG